MMAIRPRLYAFGRWMIRRFGEADRRHWWCRRCSLRINYRARFCPMCGSDRS